MKIIVCSGEFSGWPDGGHSPSEQSMSPLPGNLTFCVFNSQKEQFTPTELNYAIMSPESHICPTRKKVSEFNTHGLHYNLFFFNVLFTFIIKINLTRHVLQFLRHFDFEKNFYEYRISRTSHFFVNVYIVIFKVKKQFTYTFLIWNRSLELDFAY